MVPLTDQSVQSALNAKIKLLALDLQIYQLTIFLLPRKNSARHMNPHLLTTITGVI